MNPRHTATSPLSKQSFASRVKSIAVVAAVLTIGLLFSACPAANEVKISVVLPLSGEYSQYGEAIRNGIQLAEEQVLAEKPTLGLIVEYLDSESDPAKGRALLEEAYKTSIAAIGGATSSEALEEIKAAEAAERALISPTASSPMLSGASRNFFRIFPSADVESANLAGYITNQLASERLAVLYQNDAYGVDTTESLKKVFTGEVVGEVPFEVSGDLAEAVSAIVATDPQAVYVAAIGEDLARAIRALRDAGVVDNETKKQWILTSSALVSPQVLASAGAAANRVFLAQTEFDLDSQEEPIVSFIPAFEARYGTKPGYYAAHGYDAMLVAAAALEEAGGHALPIDFIKALRNINNLPGVTGSLQFRESGDVQKFTKGYWVMDGVAVDYEAFVKKRTDEIKERQRKLQREMEANARKLREAG